MFLKITSFFKNDFRLRKNYDDIREGLPGGSMVNNLPFSAGDLRDVGSIPESGTSPGVRKGSALQYSCLGNPVDRAVWRLRVHGVAKSWTRPSTYTETVLVVVQLQLTLRDPMDCSTPGFPLLHCLPKFAQTRVLESVMPSNHLILCRPLLLPPSVFPSMSVFSSESALHIKGPKYWSFSFSVSPSNE